MTGSWEDPSFKGRGEPCLRFQALWDTFLRTPNPSASPRCEQLLPGLAEHRVQPPLMWEPAGRVPVYLAAGFGPICFSSALIYIPGMDQKTK